MTAKQLPAKSNPEVCDAIGTPDVSALSGCHVSIRRPTTFGGLHEACLAEGIRRLVSTAAQAGKRKLPLSKAAGGVAWPCDTRTGRHEQTVGLSNLQQSTLGGETPAHL